VFASAVAQGRRRSDAWHEYISLADGSTYVRWAGVGEFLVDDDGYRIACRQHEQCSLESFQVYLLGQALSFALVKQHLEPLHATAVVVGDRAVAFLGDHAFGKSSLAASFLAAGYRLLTDDLLVLQEASGEVVAYPGPPRIKLFPQVARRFLGSTIGERRMNPDTNKLIVPLDDRLSEPRAVPITAIYSLASPRDASRATSVTVTTLSPREGFVALLKGAFNRRLVEAPRLERQFRLMARLADRLSIKRLGYPRVLGRLDEVRDIVIADSTRATHRVRASA
jgi:hypothetical protein